MSRHEIKPFDPAHKALVLAAIIEHGGKIKLISPGQWSWGIDGARVGRVTIDNLVARGRMRFTEYRVSRGARVPVAAEVVGA